MNKDIFYYQINSYKSFIIELVDKKIDSKYYIEEKIATGGHSLVFNVRNNQDEHFAMKLFFKDTIEDISDELECMKIITVSGNERFFTTLLDYGTLDIKIKMVEHKTQKSSAQTVKTVPYLITSLAKGDLPSFICEKKSSITFLNKLNMSLNLVEALAILHEKNLIHRDIKPENILQNGDSLILSDFGLSIQTINSKKRIRIEGPRYWPTPEHLNPCKEQSKATQATDVFQLACILYYVFTGIYPLGYWESNDIFGNDILDLKMKKKKELLKGVLHTALHYDNESRFQNGMELHKAFINILELD